MQEININVTETGCQRSPLLIGYQGENEVTRVIVDYSAWTEEFGAGSLALEVMRSGDEIPYLAPLTFIDDKAVWLVSNVDTGARGEGAAGFVFTVGEQVKKSAVFRFFVGRDVGGTPGDRPDPYESLITYMEKLLVQTEENAAAAETAQGAAEAARDAAASSATDAAGSATTATEQAQAAATARAAAEAAKQAAETAQGAAETAQRAAEAARDAAASSATDAAGSATTATEQAQAAATARAAAEAAQQAAETAQTAAETAQTAAETAQQAAEAARDAAAASATAAAGSATTATEQAQAAATARAAAEAAQQAAETAQTAAETAQQAAETAQTAAETAQQAAEAARDAAAASATAAAGSATAAVGSATAAADSAAAAASSATAAGNAQTAAEDAQEAAETAQAAAESARDTAITTLQTEGAAQRTAIQQKGAETLASIPEDYTDLTEEVDDLKSAVNNFDGYIQQIPSASYSGSPVTINSDEVPVINDAILYCYPKHNNSIPSPDNPVNVEGYLNIALTQVHDESTDEHVFTIYNSNNQAITDPVMGGTLNTKTGEFADEYYKRADLNTLSWVLRKTIGDYHLFDWRGSYAQTQGRPDTHNCSNVLQYVDYDQTNYYNRVVPENVDKTFSVNTSGRIYIWSTAGTVKEFKEWLGSINAYVVYRRKSHDIYTSTPKHIIVYDGSNTFYLENGVVQINYKSFGNYTNNDDFKKFNFRLNYDTVKTIAHRGDNTVAPQCTAPAYIAAKKNGAKYAENDLNISSDGAYVMWHDTSLSRLGTYLKDINGYDMYTDGTSYYWYDSANDRVYTWSGYEYQDSAVEVSTLTRCAGADYSVTNLTLSILKRIDFGSYKGAEFNGTQILTFAEWVLLCKQLGLSCYVDQKTTFTSTVASNIVQIARNLGMLDKMTWLATNQSNEIRANDPKARVLILSNPTEELIQQYSSLLEGGPVVFGGNATTLTESATHLALDAGFEVEGYYVDVDTSDESKLAFIKTLVGYGVTGLTLDHYFVSDAFEDMVLN